MKFKKNEIGKSSPRKKHLGRAFFVYKIRGPVKSLEPSLLVNFTNNVILDIKIQWLTTKRLQKMLEKMKVFKKKNFYP